MGSGMGSGMGYGMGPSPSPSGMYPSPSPSGMYPSPTPVPSGMYPSPSPVPSPSGMGMDCCPKKKIWGSMNQKMDGMYVNVGKMPWGKLPMRCNSDCVYEREGSYDGLKYCFGDSMYSQSECAADMGDGEEPVDMGPGDGSGSDGMGGDGSGSGGMGGYGSGSGGMGSDYGSGSGGMGDMGPGDGSG